MTENIEVNIKCFRSQVVCHIAVCFFFNAVLVNRKTLIWYCDKNYIDTNKQKKICFAISAESNMNLNNFSRKPLTNIQIKSHWTVKYDWKKKVCLFVKRHKSYLGRELGLLGHYRTFLVSANGLIDFFNICKYNARNSKKWIIKKENIWEIQYIVLFICKKR